MSRFPRIVVSVLAISLVLAMAQGISASAATTTVEIKGHVSTSNGDSIEGLIVEVTSTSTNSASNTSTITSPSGRYAIAVRPNATYAIAFYDADESNDGIDDRRFVGKSGHVAVGDSDYRLNKKLARTSSPDTVLVEGSVHNFGGNPIRILVAVQGSSDDGTRIAKSVKTSSSGDYFLTVPAHRTYAIRFTDVGKGGVVYRGAAGHVQVGAKDVHLNKRLHIAS